MKEIPLADSEVHSPLWGVSPSLLLSQVKNTTPFIFDSHFTPSPSIGLTYLVSLRNAAAQESQNLSYLSYPEYFELCLSAHHATLASYHPTEVGNQVHFKLWDPSLSKDIISKMAFIVTKSYAWDSTLISNRWITSPLSGERLSTHCGEWLRTAIGAYGALKKKYLNCATDLAGLINREIQREIQVYEDIKSFRDGISLLKASAVLIHNLGDLDRIIDMWDLSEDDTLKSKPSPTLIEAGRLCNDLMIAENPRHYELRESRCLRRNADLLLPLGPFWDEWGNRVAQHPELRAEEKGTVVEALVSGYERLKGPIGYTRALAGLIDGFSGGLQALCQHIPPHTARLLRTGLLSSLCLVPKRKFEEQWNEMALRSTS
jgi:hypothetical protein